jgi:hypothetical protein
MPEMPENARNTPGGWCGGVRAMGGPWRTQYALVSLLRFQRTGDYFLRRYVAFSVHNIYLTINDLASGEIFGWEPIRKRGGGGVVAGFAEWPLIGRIDGYGTNPRQAGD